MQTLTFDILKKILPNMPTSSASIVDELNKVAITYQINTLKRMAMFIAQTGHETGQYTTFVENLNYSADALVKVWPNRFDQKSAGLYARNPEKIANKVYANRMGNGTEQSGEGWKYRGRGAIQATGKDMYVLMTKELGVDFVANPDLLAQPNYAIDSACVFWRSRSLNVISDTGSVLDATKKINGGVNGLDDRQKLYDKAVAVLKPLFEAA